MYLGNVEIHTISDGVMHLDGGTMFGVLPRTVWSRYYPADDQNRIPVATNCNLIISEGRRILVDTGLGSRLTPRETQLWGLEREGDLVEKLGRLGISPEDIDVVVLTHLHPDHAAGNTRLEDSKLVPVFSRAEHWVQKREWEAATNPNDWSKLQYDQRNFMPIAESGLLRLIDGETAITQDVRCILAEGHTPGHQCVVIESKSEWAIVPSDAAPMVPHVERPQWLPAFDMEPMTNLETKKRICRMALEKKGIFLLAHDPNALACRLVEQDGRVKSEVVAWPFAV